VSPVVNDLSSEPNTASAWQSSYGYLPHWLRPLPGWEAYPRSTSEAAATGQLQTRYGIETGFAKQYYYHDTASTVIGRITGVDFPFSEASIQELGSDFYVMEVNSNYTADLLTDMDFVYASGYIGPKSGIIDPSNTVDLALAVREIRYRFSKSEGIVHYALCLAKQAAQYRDDPIFDSSNRKAVRDFESSLDGLDVVKVTIKRDQYRNKICYGFSSVKNPRFSKWTLRPLDSLGFAFFTDLNGPIYSQRVMAAPRSLHG
jgi:hypothetical protein